jgi:hypothetical protein
MGIFKLYITIQTYNVFIIYNKQSQWEEILRAGQQQSQWEEILRAGQQQSQWEEILRAGRMAAVLL